MLNLSPAARRGIFHNLIARDSDTARLASETKARRRVEEVTCWRCLECDALHEDEDEAMDCCEPAVAVHDEEIGDHCPVCSKEYANPHEVADCCLWKDIDAPTRWRMACQVEAGSTWAQVLGVEGGVA